MNKVGKSVKTQAKGKAHDEVNNDRKYYFITLFTELVPIKSVISPFT
jgi:hypothetical protein